MYIICMSMRGVIECRNTGYLARHSNAMLQYLLQPEKRFLSVFSFF